MILANVNIGTGPSAGDGDPLRTAFTVINQNFTKIQSNVNTLTNSVTTVAGRTGNVTLTTQDIIGINNYANLAYVDSKISANISTIVAGAPGALDTLRELANALGNNASFSTYITNTLTTLESNDAVQSGAISVLQNDIATLTANAGAQANSISTLYAVNAVQANSISLLFGNAGAQSGALASLTSNAAVQAGLIANLSSANYYTDSNVAAYLPTYTGNIKVDNIIFDDLSEQHTAYTGVQWRSNLSSNVTVKPSWLSYYPDGLKTVLGTHYGFDSSGMFFNGSADGEHAYPIRTNTHFHSSDAIEIIATINFAHTGDDPGIAIFNSTATPIWEFTTHTSRIAFEYNSGIPSLLGRTTQSIAGGAVLTAGNTYTFKFHYDPVQNPTITVTTYSGANIAGSVLDSRTINETLPEGDYVAGFDADQDTVGDKTYFTNLIVRTLTNTVVHNLEVTGTLDGNLTMSSGTITLPQTNMFASPQPVSYPGIIFTDATKQITAYTASYANASPTPTSVGTKGNIVVDGTYMYHCIAANTWVRTSITTSW
jgi:hypothetical protein